MGLVQLSFHTSLQRWMWDNATMVVHSNTSHLCRVELLGLIVSAFRIEVQMAVRITLNSSTIIASDVTEKYVKVCRPQRMGFLQSLQQCQTCLGERMDWNWFRANILFREYVYFLWSRRLCLTTNVTLLLKLLLNGKDQ